MNDRDLHSSLLEKSMQALFEPSSAWPVWLLTIALVCAALIGLSILLTKLRASTNTPFSLRPPLSSSPSLLSPTLAVELLEPNAAQAWLLSVSLDLAIAQHHTLSPGSARKLLDLNRATRLLLLDDLRDPDRDDARLLPITLATLDLAHTLSRRPEQIASSSLALSRAIKDHRRHTRKRRGPSHCE